MVKLLFMMIALLGGSVVRGQNHGSFLGSSNRPLCAIRGNYCIENADCCEKSCNTTSQRCVAGAPTTTTSTTTVRPNSVSDPLSNRVGEESSSCQQIGNSCQRGRDCCSGACLVSSRKCVKGRRGEPQSVDAGRVCSRVNQQCSSQPCCTFLTCERNVCRDKSVFVEGTETAGAMSSVNNSNNLLANRFSEDESTDTVNEASTTVKCVEIGLKCFRPEECCRGLKCHGFLHQCVS